MLRLFPFLHALKSVIYVVYYDTRLTIWGQADRRIMAGSQHINKPEKLINIAAYSPSAVSVYKQTRPSFTKRYLLPHVNVTEKA